MMKSQMSSSSTKGGGSSSNNNSIMSVTIGGRVVTPHLSVVDASGPSKVEESFDELLSDFCKTHVPLEDREGIRKRERALNQMKNLCRQWIQFVCWKKQLPQDMVENAGGQLFTSGSYRLGVHEPGADIDVILVAPNICTRADFFGNGASVTNADGTSSNARDPNSLAERLKAHPDVTNLVAVEDAMVPILTFDWEGVNIDLLFAVLNNNHVPDDLDIDNDVILDGVDAATEKSLNGPRVTNLIAALVSGTPERYQVFLAVVRVVRKWAKARGLYSNKMGYWGGVNINIAVAFCLQLYPNACAASLLRKFFLVFKSWRWPNPILLTKPHDAGLGLTVWNAYHVNTMRQVAPIITPAYPAMNSALSVSRQTLQILHEEFCRAHDIMDEIWKQHSSSSSEGPVKAEDFGKLIVDSDFFIAYPYYVSLCIVAPTEAQEQRWVGFVESRLRKLVSDMLGKSLPLRKIQLWPQKFDACIADRTALLTKDQRRNSVTYFIGFLLDKLRMRGNLLNVEQQFQNFSSWELSRFTGMEPGMDIMCQRFTVKTLPQICFPNGTKVQAMKRRKQIRKNDPKRIQARKLAKLQSLKNKMETLKRKRNIATNTSTDPGTNTTTSSATTIETDITPSIDDKSTVESNNQSNDNEASLLEQALDQMVNNTKTREEAERDKELLLKGEADSTGKEEQEQEVIDDDEDENVYDPFYSSSNTIKRVKQENQSKKEEPVVVKKELDYLDVLREAGYVYLGSGEEEDEKKR